MASAVPLLFFLLLPLASATSAESPLASINLFPTNLEEYSRVGGGDEGGGKPAKSVSCEVPILNKFKSKEGTGAKVRDDY